MTIENVKLGQPVKAFSKEALKKAVEEYDQKKDKGLVRLIHGERTGCVDLDFRSLFTDIKEVDISKQVLETLKSERWKNRSKGKSIGDEMRIE